MDIWILGYIAVVWVIGWGLAYSLYKARCKLYGMIIGKIDLALFFILWMPFLIAAAFDYVFYLALPQFKKHLKLVKGK